MISWGRVFELRQRLKGSLWALPLVGCLTGLALGQADLLLEDHLHLPADLQYSAATASSVLAAVIGAMVGLLGLVVTITVLVVQQATGTLSPRYMRLWYRDRLQKVVVAMFVGTFAFAYSLLRRVEEGSVPVLGVTLTGVFVLSSLVLLLFYVNRFTHNLRPVAVAAGVAAAGAGVVDRAAGERAHGGAVGDVEVQTARLASPSLTVTATRHGTIQAVSERRLLREAREHDCVVVLVRSIGDFVTEGTPLMTVHGASSPSGRTLEGLVATGVERTIEQDPAFALRILVDIAIRALSPAVNDPTTAVQVLDYVELLLRVLAPLPLATSYGLADEDGALRVVVPGRSWEEFVSLATTEIRIYGQTAPQVCRRLRAVLEGLLASAPAGHRAVVAAELARLDAGIDTSFPDQDARDLARVADRQGIGGRGRELPPVPGPRTARQAAVRVPGG